MFVSVDTAASIAIGTGQTLVSDGGSAEPVLVEDPHIVFRGCTGRETLDRGYDYMYMGQKLQDGKKVLEMSVTTLH